MKIIKQYAENLVDQAATDNIQKLSVAAAIMHGSKILLLKRLPTDFMPNIYELPGGGLEKDETLIDALHREIKEETSCTIDHIIGYIGHIDFSSSSGLLTRRFNFLVKPQCPFSICLTEHATHAWISPINMHLYDITPQTKGIITSLVKNDIVFF